MLRPLLRHIRRHATDFTRLRAWLAAAACVAVIATVRPACAQETLPTPPLGTPEVVAPGEPEFSDSGSKEMVAEVRIVGNETVPTVKVEGQITTRAGRAFDPSVINRDVRRLANVGWFVDVKAKTVHTPQGRIVVFEVVERPTIRYIEYLGNERISDKGLAKQTLLKIGGSVDPQSVLEGRRKLEEHYRSKGFNDVQVTVLEGSKPTDKGIVYLINEGEPQKITSIRFVGNEFVSSSRLRKAVVKTRKPILWMWKGYVDYDKIQIDVDQLTAYYRAFGFFDARVGRKIDFDDNGRSATLTFVINEGPRYNVRNVRFMGNTKFEAEPLAAQAKVQDGQPFEQSKMTQTADWLQELYGSRGYVFADIKPETVYLDDPGQVDLIYHIDEGKQWRVGRIFVHINGDNPHTRIQTALNRLTLRPGDIMDIRELKASERRLQASSLYHVDAATGQRPKITYKIPEDYDLQMAAAEGELRGQSVAALDAPLEPFKPVPLLPPPGASHLENFAAGLPQIAADRDGTDVHVYCDDYEHYLRWVETEDLAATPGAVMPASYEVPIVDADATGPANGELAPIIDSRNLPNSTPNNCARPVTPPTWPAGSQPPIDAEPPHPLSTPPQGGRQPRPQFAEPVYRGQSPEQAPRTDLWWTQPRTARRPVVSAAQPTPTQYAQPTAAPQQVAPNWSAPAAAPTHYAATPAPQPAAAVAPPAGNAYSQFAAPAQYAATPYGGNQYAASPYAAAPRATQPTAAPGYQAAPQYQPLQLARTDPYQTVRGQSPAPAGSNAYAALPTGGATQPAYAGTYGGQTVQPTNPASAPIRDAAVQPTQYSSQIQPPAGSIAPTPLSPMGALPGYVLFPDGRYGPVGEPYDDQAVDIFIDAAETQTGRLQMGFGVNSDAGVVGNFVVDERNFDWRQWPTSFEDFRNGQAFRGDGQRFRLEASPGSQVNRYLASFQDPYFLDRPIMLGLSGSFFDRRYSDWDEQRLGGRISLGYQWVERDLSASLTYRGENVNIRNISNPNVADLEDVVGDNVIHGFGVTVINDTRDSSFLPTRGYYVQLSGEQVIGSYIYPRATAEMRKYWRLTERPDHSGAQVLSFSTNVGWTGGNTPIFERFYAGGFATFRGFNFRGASPVRENVEVGGGFQWLNSVQYLFPLTADDMLHGVAFCDFGTVEENVTIKNFRVAPGVGLRITVPAMGPAPIALDFAWAVSRADTDDPQVFSFSIGFSR